MICVSLVAGDLSRTVAASAGEPVCVLLEDMSTTGYRWEATADPASTAVADRGVEPGEAPGASGLRRFAATPEGPGRTVIRFALRRPWQAGAPPEQEATVIVDVR